MKKKQAVIIILVCCSLLVTIFFAAISVYFMNNSSVADATDSINDNQQPNRNYIQEIAVKRTGDEQDKEIRGVWISTVYNIDFPSKAGVDAQTQKQEIDNIIKNAKSANLNTIFFQVRPTSDALYKSEIYPTSAYLTGKQGASLVDGFDPLAYIIEQCHQNGIKLHAWINPFRITPGSKATYEKDVAALSPTNPAVVHKEWTVAYEDGKLYFDPGIPQARELIISGAVEIVKNYDVDGIHIDDYFYPYPVYITDDNGKKVIADFDDSKSYNMYGEGRDKSEWRRDNINTFVRDLNIAVKQVREDCEFGVSCAGIWANQSSKKGGSATNGMQSYFDTYADSKYWVENKFVDYICPQIYWEMSHKSAPFDVICKWWSSVVDGTGVKLYIGHGLYKNENWSDKTEIPRQVEFARSWHGYKGSVFFGYDQIELNKDGMRDKLAQVFYEDYYHPDAVPTGEAVTFGSPQPSYTLKAGNSYILGKSDPGYPLYYKGEKIPRTQNGYFNIYETISKGENRFAFTQNGLETVITLSTNSSQTKPKQNILSGVVIENPSPKNDIITYPGREISVSCVAPAGSKVTVTLGDSVFELTAQDEVSLSPEYLPQTYKGTVKLPSNVEEGTIADLGNLIFKAEFRHKTATYQGANIKIKSETAKGFIEVLNDFSHTKLSPSSSFYDDYLPSSVGMRDYVESLENGYYKLRFGGYIEQKNAKFVEGSLIDGKILSAQGRSDDKNTVIKFGITENVPVDAGCDGNDFYIKFFNVSPEYVAQINDFENPLFENYSYQTDEKNQTVTYRLKLVDKKNFYGFDIQYQDSAIVVTLKNPIKLDLNKKYPLEGVKIIVDAGHGGSDSGALGFMSGGDNAANEKDLNLSVSKAVEKYLTAYGATVIMTRTQDITMSLEERMAFLNTTLCDLSISIHHNSLDYTANISRVRGFVGLWWADGGELLTKSISKAVTNGINRYERTPVTQRLALCRNHKFPSTLLELGFITSAEEYEFITQSANIDLAARAIADGVIEYFKAQQQYL